MLSALRPLQHRNFALIWWAALLSNVGSWMQTVAVGVFVTARTGRPGWTGLVAAAAFLPIGLLSPLGGVIADRLDRRILVVRHHDGRDRLRHVPHGAGSHRKGHPCNGDPTGIRRGCHGRRGFPAYQAMLPDLVPPSELGAAISLGSAQYNMGRVIGPALAGFAIVVGGYSWAFGINAASFFAVMIALGLVHLPRATRSTAPASLRQRLVEGGRATLANPATRVAVVLISVVALTASPFIALVPAVALKAFASKATGTSVLITAQGIGAVGGALALTPLVHRFGRRQVLVASMVAVCVFLCAYGLAPDLWLGAVALLLVGAAYIGVLAGCNTIVQLYAPASLRGRMLGIYMMALGILYPIGALAQGAIANVVGIRAVTVGGALVLLVLLVTVLRRSIPANLEGQPGPVPNP